jgi:hypothetical protein
VTAKWNGSTVYQTTDPDFTNGSWQHFVLVRDGSLVTVYRDNVVVTSFTHTAPFTPEFIGCKTSGGNYYQGTMDDLAIWGRALSTEEIATLYNDGNGLEVLSSSNSSVVFSLEGTPPSGAVIDPVSGFFMWTPDETQGPDLYSITVKATDEGDPQLFDTEEFGVTVNEVNQPPIIEAISDLSVNEEELLSLMVIASDPDIPSNSLSYSLGEGSILGMAIDPTSGMFTWTPTEAQGPGIYPVLIRVTDDGTPSLESEETFLVTVAEVNTAPILEPIGDQIAVLDTELTFTAVANDNDFLIGLADGLVAHWSFDVDYTSSTGQHDGVSMNGADITTTPGEFVLGGGALHFDGVDDYLDFGDTPLPLDFTLSAWVYPTNIDIETSSSAIVFGDGANADWIRLETDGVRAKWDNVTTVMTSEPDFQNGSWQLFTLVRVGTTVSAYRNGVLVTSAVISEEFTPEFLGLKTPNTNHYGGFMDDVAIWGRALSVDEVSSLYNDGAGNPLGGALPNPANTLVFSLEGTVPAGAGIDPVTGVFSWTPSPEQAPGEYTLTVRVTDDGEPPLHDEETITVRVFEEEPQVICDVDPVLIDFGAVALEDSVASSFTIRNLGVLEFSGSISESCDHFQIVEGGGPFTLAEGDTLVVTIAFTPHAEGDFACTIQLGENPCAAVECLGMGRDTSGTGMPVPVFALTQNYPNPFNPTTRIQFGLAGETKTSLVIFDIAGRQVRSLVQGVMGPGLHTVEWNGKDDGGHPVAAGVYFYRLQAGDYRETKRMALVK